MGHPLRVEIFLDGSNFYNGLRSQFGHGQYSVEKLVNRIVAGRTLVRLNFYVGTIDPGRDPKGAAAQQRFLHSLSRLPFPKQICAFPMRYYAGWPQVPPLEKGIDAKIVQDLIIGAVDKTYDAAVVLTGDQDFIEVVRLLHSRFAVRLETYFPMARRHLHSKTQECFAIGQVITKDFYDSIR